MDLSGITNNINVDVNQYIEEAVGLPNVDEGQLNGYDDDINILIHVRDPDEHNMPSIKHSTLMFVALFLGLVLLSAMLMVTIIYCSRRQERSKKSKQSAKQEGVSISLRDNLTCRPWSDNYWGDDTAELSEAGSTSNEGVSTDDSSVSDISASVVDAPAPAADLEAPSSSPSRLSSLEVDPDEHRHADNCCAVAFNGESTAVADESSLCRLCKTHFELGQPVYESNNPQCRHKFHMNCMNRWLDYQNTCPTCNAAYVLQTV